MHIVLTGATGLVGSAALEALLGNSSVTKVTILSRKPVLQAEKHAKVSVIHHQDFSTYPGPNDTLTEAIKDASGCIWALGISQNAVSKKEYVAITKDYPTSFVKYLSSIISSPCTFVLVSADGATQKPGILTPFYGKVKGEVEADLLAISEEKDSKIPVYITRPAAVDPTKHKELLALGKTASYPKLSKVLFPVFNTLYPAMMSPTQELGQSLVMLATMKGEGMQGPGTEHNGHIINNAGLRAMTNFVW